MIATARLRARAAGCLPLDRIVITSFEDLKIGEPIVLVDVEVEILERDAPTRGTARGCRACDGSLRSDHEAGAF